MLSLAYCGSDCLCHSQCTYRERGPKSILKRFIMTRSLGCTCVNGQSDVLSIQPDEGNCGEESTDMLQTSHKPTLQVANNFARLTVLYSNFENRMS